MTAKQKTASVPKPATSKPKPVEEKSTEFAFGKENYRLLLIGIVIIAIGFILMIGGGSDNPAVFNEKIFSPRRITIAPVLILIGYVIEIFAIMKKPVDK